MVEQEQLLTINETAALLRISRKTLERWRHSGTLVPVVIGGVIRYRRADIETLLEAAS